MPRLALIVLLLSLFIRTTAVASAEGEKKEAPVEQEPKIIQVEEMKYVGMSITHKPFEKDSKAIPELWNKFIKRNAEIKDKTGPSLGIAGDFDKQNASASYIAAAQVKSFDAVPEGMVKGTVPAGTYAEFKHKGPIATFGKTVGYIHGVWLPKSGYKNGGAMVEVYPKDKDVDAADFEMTVLLPVSK